MANIYTLPYSLESGKCYYISGNIRILGGGDSVVVELGDGVTYDTIGTLSVDGGFSIQFTYDADPVYSKIRLTRSGNPILYNLKLRLNSQCVDKICSECFKIDDCEPAHREHLKLEWTNNEPGLGFIYNNFVNSLYIVGGLRNADYAYDEETFVTADRRRFRPYTASDKTIELWIHDIPEYLHDAIAVGLVHDEFYVNGVRYFKVDGGYTPDWDTPNSLLAPCVVKISEFQRDVVNDNCT